MRIAHFCLLIAFVGGCGTSQPTSNVDRIEIRESGWSAVNIAVNRRGAGHFDLSDGRNGSFTLTPQQFERISERLEPFRGQAVPFTEESIREFIDGGCPEGVPFVTDAGAVYIRWISASSDQHYLADFECDHERNDARNDELRAIVRSFPVPLG